MEQACTGKSLNKRFKPQYLPYNNDAHALVEALAAELGLSLKGITGAKHKTILASFLHCVQEAGVGAYLDGQVALQAKTQLVSASFQLQVHLR